MKKVALIKLRRDRNSFGFTISGGRTENRPITVSNVTVGSMAYKYVVLGGGAIIWGLDTPECKPVGTIPLKRKCICGVILVSSSALISCKFFLSNKTAVLNSLDFFPMENMVSVRGKNNI